MSSPSIKTALKDDLHAQLIQLAFGFMPAACLYAVAKLKVADLLANGPKSVRELARVSRKRRRALPNFACPCDGRRISRCRAPNVRKHSSIGSHPQRCRRFGSRHRALGV